MHNIVILGGNFAGVSTAHYLLRHVLPSLNSTTGDRSEYKVTLISPSDHTFYKIGAPRALVSAEIVPLDKSFASIPDAFSDYKTSEFSFIQGEAVQVDEAAKTVSVNSAGNTKNTLVLYNSLVIATGTTSTSPLWTLHGDYKHTTAAFEDMHKRLPQAKTILIAGGGPGGVETAGEIAYLYKPKDITILSGGTRLLPRLRHTGVAKAAERQLESLNVKTIHNIKATSSTELSDGKTSVRLSDGSTKTVDIYINATGGAPNTSFLPASWLDDSKRIAADMSTLRATNAPAGVYSIGDAASFSKGSVMDAQWAVPALGYSIWSDLRKTANGKERLPAGTVALKEKKYKQIAADMQAVPIGPNGGVGVIFGWKIPSFLVWLLKSRTFHFDKAPGVATGANFLKP
jgi:apoptosis-inducing factor 2